MGGSSPPPAPPPSYATEYKQLLLAIISISIVDFEWREKDTLTSEYGSSWNSEIWGYFTLYSTGIGWRVGLGDW